MDEDELAALGSDSTTDFDLSRFWRNLGSFGPWDGVGGGEDGDAECLDDLLEPDIVVEREVGRAVIVVEDERQSYLDAPAPCT